MENNIKRSSGELVEVRDKSEIRKGFKAICIYDSNTQTREWFTYFGSLAGIKIGDKVLYSWTAKYVNGKEYRNIVYIRKHDRQSTLERDSYTKQEIDNVLKNIFAILGHINEKVETMEKLFTSHYNAIETCQNMLGSIIEKLENPKNQEK